MSIYLRGVTWYIDIERGKRRLRTSLYTSDREEALKRAEEIERFAQPKRTPAPWQFSPKWASERLTAMRHRSKGRDCMSRADLEALVARCGGRCELTGIPFSADCPRGCKRAPLAPSVDRIDHRLSYTFENCRIVCFAVNVAMNQWGEDVLRRIALAYVAPEQGHIFTPQSA